MTTLSAAKDAGPRIGTRFYGTSTRVAVGAASAPSAAIDATEVLLHATTKCFVRRGTDNSVAALNTDLPLEAGEKFHMRLNPGEFIGVIRDTADGFLYIVPVV